MHLLASADLVFNAMTVTSSVLFSSAAFFASWQMIGHLLDPRIVSQQGSMDQTRWERLHATAPWFRAFPRFVIGLAQMVRNRFAWLLVPPNPKHPVPREAMRVFKWISGDPDRLEGAVKVRSNEQPWIASEVIAVAMIVATFVACGATIVIGSEYKMLGMAVVASLSWLLTYRFFLWRFIAQAHLRQRLIRRFLPHAMDTVAMVMASGDPFRKGLDTVVEDFPNHPLGQEFRRLRSHLDRGQTVHSALAAVAETINLPEFHELVRVLTRIHQHGAPAADNFGKLAKQLRINQLRYMEEEVGKSEATMALPTMLVLLAAMIVSAAPFLLSLSLSDLINP